MITKAMLESNIGQFAASGEPLIGADDIAATAKNILAGPRDKTKDDGAATATREPEKIKIINTRVFSDIRNWTPAEKENLVRELAAKKIIPRTAISSITYLLVNMFSSLDTSILEIVLKKIIELGDGQYVPVVDYIKQDVMTAASATATASKLAVSFNTMIPAELPNGRATGIPKGSLVNIIGLRFRPGSRSGEYFSSATATAAAIAAETLNISLDEPTMRKILAKLNYLHQFGVQEFHPLPQPISFAIPEDKIGGRIIIAELLKSHLSGLPLLSYYSLIGYIYINIRAIIAGVKSKGVINDIEKHKKEIRMAQFVRKYQQQIIIEKRKNREMNILAQEKFGVDLSALGADKIATIEAEYESRRKYMSSLISNTCPHVAIYRALRHAMETGSATLDIKMHSSGAADSKLHSSGTAARNLTPQLPLPSSTYLPLEAPQTFTPAEILAKLMEYSSGDREYKRAGSGDRTREIKKDFHICRECKFPLACSHLTQLVTAMYSDLPNAESLKMSRSVVANFTEGKKTSCAVCGEMLPQIEDSFDLSGIKVEMDEELRREMWSECSAALRNVIFVSIIDTTRLISSIVKASYPAINEISRALEKSKTATAEEIKNRRKLFISIFIYSYLIYLAHSQGASAAVSTRTSEPGIKYAPLREPGIKYAPLREPGIKIKGAAPGLLGAFNAALKHIIDTKNVIIRGIRGMTNEVIKNKIIDAYKSIKGFDIEKDPSEGAESTAMMMLLLDPVIKAYFVFGPPNIPRIMPSEMQFFADKIRETKLVGETIVSKPKTAAKSKNVQRSHDSQPPLMLEGFANRMRASTPIQKQLYSIMTSLDALTTPFYQSIKIKGEEDSGVIKDEHKKYIALYEEFFSDAIIGAHTPSRAVLPPHANIRSILQNTNILRLYDENGEPHKFDILVFSGTKSATVEHKIGDFIAAAEGKREPINLSNTNIIDTKCSICGIRYSTVSSLDKKKVYAAIDERKLMANMIKYYEMRCPVDNARNTQNVIPTDIVSVPINGSGISTHNFASDGACTKCGFKQNIQPAEYAAYYKKYYKKYAEDKNDIGAIIEAEDIELEETTFDFPQKISATAIIASAANLYGVKSGLLAALGATEGIDYNIVSGSKFIPQESDKRFHERIFVIYGRIMELIAQWSMVNNIKRLSLVPEAIKEVYEGVANKTLGITSEQLNGEFYDKFNYFKMHNPPQKVIEWCLEQLCSRLISLHEASDLARKFGQYFVKMMLEHDYFLCKPGYFSWSALYGNREVKDAPIGEDSDTAIHDQQAIADDDDEDETPFKNNFDIEKDVAEGVDAEDDDTGNMNAGADHGI